MEAERVKYSFTQLPLQLREGDSHMTPALPIRRTHPDFEREASDMEESGPHLPRGGGSSYILLLETRWPRFHCQGSVSSPDGGGGTFQRGPAGTSPGPVPQDALGTEAPAQSSQQVGFPDNPLADSCLKSDRVEFCFFVRKIILRCVCT